MSGLKEGSLIEASSQDGWSQVQARVEIQLLLLGGSPSLEVPFPRLRYVAGSGAVEAWVWGEGFRIESLMTSADALVPNVLVTGPCGGTAAPPPRDPFTGSL